VIFLFEEAFCLRKRVNSLLSNAAQTNETAEDLQSASFDLLNFFAPTYPSECMSGMEYKRDMGR
jgi:hypothetical protein